MRRPLQGALAIGLVALLAPAACSGALPQAQAAPAPAQVLLLNSYHKGFAWSDEITRGVESVIGSADRPIELSVEYMDTKRRNDETHYRTLHDLCREKFPSDLFRVVITADDDALIFALRYRDELFPRVPIVFCGFSHYPRELLAGQSGVTGVVETQDVAQTVELALRLHPEAQRVLAINDLTTTGVARQRQIDDVTRSLAGRVAVETVADVTADELEARLRRLGERDVVFLQGFNRDRSGRVFNPREIMELLARSCRRPVYTIKEEYLGLGVVGGYLTAGVLHGEAAARMALRILAGADPASLPVVADSINPPQFDDAQLRRFRIDPARLPPGSRRVNLPQSFYAEHRQLVIGGSAAVSTLLLVILALGGAVRTRRRAEEDLAITLHSIGDAVIATDTEARVARLNPAAEALTGWRAAEARGRPLGEVFCTLDAGTRAARPLPLEAILKRGEVSTLHEDALLVARDGAERRVADSAAPIRDRRGRIRGMVLVFRDVSERLLMEERLRQAQKMETVGRLAGGIAHDFNNLLGGIIGYADLLIGGLGANERHRAWAERIVETAERAAGLTRNLLAFSRKGQLHAVPIDLHQVVREVIGILEQTIDRRIAIATRLEAAAPVVVGDLSQVQSAVLNLGVNARDAMPGGGTITFATAGVELGPEQAAALPEPVAPGRYVTLSVEDTGLGMPREVLAHIFEPFFSTKPVGKGTGLGLAAVYGTVRGLGGTIEVSSAPGSGSTFRLYLPAGAARTAAPGRPLPRPGAGCVLVVDDEQVIRGMARDMLRELGYEVLLAGDGDEALEVFQRERARIALVILDVMMPRRSGPETLRGLQAIDPGVRVLVSSGFDFDAASRELFGDGVSGFLQKPFRIAELSEKVAEAMGRAAAPPPETH
jgi:PAS domain S-box-containing protein